MEMQTWRNPWIIGLLTFTLGVLLIYTYGLYPLTAFFLAFLFSYIAEEDYRTHLIDMRVAILLAVTIVLLRGEYVLFFICAYSISKAVLWDLTEFRSQPVEIADTTKEFTVENYLSYINSLKMGFIPLLVAALMLLLLINMLFYPWSYIEQSGLSGDNFWTEVVQTHYFFTSIATYLNTNLQVYIIITAVCCTIAAGSYIRLIIKTKLNKGKEIITPFGDGDPIVISSMIAIVGGEVFLYGVFFLAIIFASIYKTIIYIRQRRIAVNEHS